jgi:predicted small metal-binding protein
MDCTFQTTTPTEEGLMKRSQNTKKSSHKIETVPADLMARI